MGESVDFSSGQRLHHPLVGEGLLGRAVEDDFEGDISIHDHDAPGAYHGWPEVPTPHYLLEISVDEEKVEELIDILNPLIDELVTRNTSDTLVPVLR